MLSKSERTKSRILEAAQDTFAEKGLFGARVDDIALRATINKRMLYEYFGSKEELYKAALLNVYEKLGAVEDPVFEQTSDPTEAIRRLVRLHFQFLRDNPNFVAMVMWENLNQARYLKETGHYQIKDVFVQAIERVVVRGKAAGIFGAHVDEKQLPVTLIGLSFSYFSNRYTLSYLLKGDLMGDAHMQQRIAHVTDIVMRYLKP